MFRKSALYLSFIILTPIVSCSKQVKVYHSNYGGYCKECNEVINGLYFPNDTVRKMPDGSYPRVIRLQNGDLLYGYDAHDEVYAIISKDNGYNWSDPVRFSLFENDDDKQYYRCANADFIQLDNGDVIGSYRSVPNDKAISEGDPYKYDYSIRSSISHDNGKTWSFFSLVASSSDTRDYADLNKVKNIIDNNSGHGGLWEPFTYQVNGKILLYYSDDFGGWYDATPKDHEFQYICCKELDFANKQWINRKICINGLQIKQDAKLPKVTSRDGMPVVAKTKDGTYVMAFEGTYFRGENHPFVTLLSHSKDGLNWSAPVEIYHPYGKGTKSGAAYIDVTSDNRLVVTFQTDEDYQEHGGEELGEAHSITKVMISDGTPVEQIDRSCFYTAQDVFHENLGIYQNSIWPMAVVEDETVYAFSDGKMNTSKIGKIDEINSYHPEVELTDCSKIDGQLVKLSNGYYRSKLGNTFYLKNNFSSNQNKTFAMHLFPRTRNNCGIVFNYDNFNYYSLMLTKNRGELTLTRVRADESNLLATNTFIKDTFTYDPNNFYELKVSIINNKTIECYVNDKKMIEFTDNDFVVGNKVGYISEGVGTVFSDFYIK